MPQYYDDLSGESDNGYESSSSLEDSAVDLCGDEPEPTRYILHVDVDCFYCQCEHIDQRIDRDRPLAIGQKHIIVTANYAARAYGVGKLELRETAYQKCPSLLIVEGSDLQRYRCHARAIYESFRQACRRLHGDVAVAKGSMDEAMADLTPAVQACAPRPLPSCCHVYSSSATQGHETIDAGLQTAAALALEIRQTILEETGFNTTLGVSTSPMLAKLTSGLHKPGTVNLVPADEAEALVRATTLRKIPSFGRATVRAMQPILKRLFPQQESWTCGDLLSVPLDDLSTALQEVPGLAKTAKEQARLILDRCRGRDASTVVDDGGGMSKVVSIENSFKRGSTRTQEAVLEGVEDLYQRLPQLLSDRKGWSSRPDRCFPTTLRLTVRSMIHDGVRPLRGRPFETHSRQIPIDGKSLMKDDDATLQSGRLRDLVYPMLRSMLFQSVTIDVTRINIALDNFQDALDIKESSGPAATQITTFTQPSRIARRATDRDRARPKQGQKSRGQRYAGHRKIQSFDQIDPSVLAELPADIAAEVRRSFSDPKRPVKRNRIDEFFTPK